MRRDTGIGWAKPVAVLKWQLVPQTVSRCICDEIAGILLRFIDIMDKFLKNHLGKKEL